MIKYLKIKDNLYLDSQDVKFKVEDKIETITI